MSQATEPKQFLFGERSLVSHGAVKVPGIRLETWRDILFLARNPPRTAAALRQTENRSLAEDKT